MNLKKALVLASIAALALPALPANAATTGTIQVKWNTQAVGTLALHTQYDGAPVGQHKATAETIYAATNGGAGTCQASDTSPDLTVNFGNVTPDSANVTDCLEINAVNAIVATNDTTGWNVSEAVTAGLAPAANYSMCAYPNGSASWPFANAAAMAATASARAAAVTAATIGTCSGGGQLLNGTSFQMNTTNTNAFTAASPANIGEDLELLIGAAAPLGAQTETVTFTLTLN